MKKPGSSDPAAGRKARLAEELRANLQRRKAQSRSRRTGEADERPEGLGAANEADNDDVHRQDGGK
jgi:hypothetical protein